MPEVAYETDRLQIAPEFDAPICEGTLLTLDNHLEDVEIGLGRVGRDDPYRLYWMRDGIAEICGEGRGGCFFPSTRMMFAKGPSITHEMTHAVLDSEGESFFLEEGMAELLSGVGVYYDASDDDQGPAARLRLSRSSYRAGGFDYAAAAHFMRWIYHHRGVAGVRRLAIEVEGGANPGQLENALEQVMGRSVEDIEREYRTAARRTYEGLVYKRIPILPIKEIEEDPEFFGPESMTMSVSVDLDCASIDTMGPLADEREGMYQIRRVDVPENSGAILRVEGEPGTWVEVFDPYAARRLGIMTDWMLPNSEVDENAITLRPGDEVEVDMHSGVWAVMLGSDDVRPGRVSLHVEMAAPLPPPDPETTR